MVGLVIVSHSVRLAEGVAELARDVGGSDLSLAVAGGLDLPGRPLGTDAMLVLRAIEAVYSDEGVLVLMDLGSAVLSAEMARDMLPAGQQEHVVLCEAPLVEGAVAAAVQARLGSPLSEVLAEARGALAAKAAHLGEAFPQLPRDASTAPAPAASETSERRLRVEEPAGLHARPAAAFVRVAGRFPEVDIRVTNVSGGRGPVDARSINAVITLGVRQGDEVLLRASGPGAAAALDALTLLLSEKPQSGKESAQSSPATLAAQVADSRAGWPLRGIPAAPGTAVGVVHLSPSTQPPGSARVGADEPPGAAAAGPQAGWEALLAALDRTAEQIRATRESVSARAGRSAAEIFDAQRLFLGDSALLEPAREAIFEGGLGAAAAWQAAVDRAAERYSDLEDPILRSRRADLLDVGRQVLANLSGLPSDDEPIIADRPVILVAHDLSAVDAAHLDLDTVLGVCTAMGGPTSHAAILARALGIPYVVGLGEGIFELSSGVLLAMDGGTGDLWPDPTPEIVEQCRKAAGAERTARVEAQRAGSEPAVTRDGRRVEVAANIGSVKDARTAVELGADGVGLFRTEFLFADRHDPPGEDEQVAAYRAVAEALAGRPLVIRTLDAGGDKPLPYLQAPVEANPFLGLRAIRLCLAQPELFLPQLRAIVRVAAEFSVKVMFPMIATLAEWREAVALLDAARAEVLARGGVAPQTIETGIMVEIPAAALLAEKFAAEVDFFSIGTNDLAQYTLAAERGNARLAALADPLQPAVLSLMREVVRSAHAGGTRVSICGELAADPEAVQLLVGLGVDELSMNAAAIPRAKQIIRTLDYAVARMVAEAAVQASSPADVRAILTSAPGALKAVS